MTSLPKRKSQVLSTSCDVFELTPINSNLKSYYKEVRVEFLGSTEKSKLSKTSKYLWPKFNNDGLFFTPAFVIPEDLAVLSLVQDCLKNDYINRIKISDELDTKDTQASLAVAQPQQQNHCGVCKTSYQSFQEHVDSINHKENCKRSKYTKYIRDFCAELFENKPSKQEEIPKIKSINQTQVIRKSSNPEPYKPKCVEMPNLGCVSSPETYDDDFIQEIYPEIDVFHLQVTPPVKRRRFY